MAFVAIAQENVEIDIKSKIKVVLKTGFVNSAEKFSKRASTNQQNFAQKIADMHHDVEQSNKECSRN